MSDYTIPQISLFPSQLDHLVDTLKKDENIQLHWMTENLRDYLNGISYKQYRWLFAMYYNKKFHTLNKFFEGRGLPRVKN